MDDFHTYIDLLTLLADADGPVERDIASARAAHAVAVRLADTAIPETETITQQATTNAEHALRESAAALDAIGLGTLVPKKRRPTPVATADRRHVAAAQSKLLVDDLAALKQAVVALQTGRKRRDEQQRRLAALEAERLRTENETTERQAREAKEVARLATEARHRIHRLTIIAICSAFAVMLAVTFFVLS